jgi:hypothetical protein
MNPGPDRSGQALDDLRDLTGLVPTRRFQALWDSDGPQHRRPIKHVRTEISSLIQDVRTRPFHDHSPRCLSGWP